MKLSKRLLIILLIGLLVTVPARAMGLGMGEFLYITEDPPIPPSLFQSPIADQTQLNREVTSEPLPYQFPLMGSAGAISVGNCHVALTNVGTDDSSSAFIDRLEQNFNPMGYAALALMDNGYYYIFDHNSQGFSETIYQDTLYWKRSDGTIQEYRKIGEHSGQRTWDNVYKTIPCSFITQTCTSSTDGYWGYWSMVQEHEGDEDVSYHRHKGNDLFYNQ